MLKQAIHILAVIMTGLIAGLMWGTGMDQYTHRLLSASAWVTEHQVMDALFSRVMPPFWNASVLVLFIAAFLSGRSARWLFLTAAVLLALSLVVTVAVEVPMNRMIAHWDAATPPADWAAVRDKWLQFHLLRTLAGIAAFALATAALLQTAKSPTSPQAAE
jgi:uncharacterized membrane protein